MGGQSVVMVTRVDNAGTRGRKGPDGEKGRARKPSPLCVMDHPVVYSCATNHPNLNDINENQKFREG